MNRLMKLRQAFSKPVADEDLFLKSSWDRSFLKNIDLEIDEDKVMSSPYTKSDLVYICISTTAKAISQVPFILLRDINGKDTPVEYNHPLYSLLEKPNLYLDRYSFIEALVSYLMLDGNVFAIPLPGPKSPSFIYVVSKNYVAPIKDKQTSQLIGWRYNSKGVDTSPIEGGSNDINLGIEDVCHIWFWNPHDPIMGQSPLTAGKIPITTDYIASRYNDSFFKNAANPGGVLSTEQKLTTPQYERLKQDIEQDHGGHKKQGKLLLLDRGLQYSQTSLTHKDMEFYDLRKFNGGRIMQVLGMKKSVISVTDDLNFATAKEQRKEWWQGTNLPIMRLITSALNHAIINLFGVKLAFDVSSIEALQEEFMEKVKTAKDLSALGFTTNEINDRLELGFERKPWRDFWWGTMSTSPLAGENGEMVGMNPEPEDDIIPVEPEEIEEESYISIDYTKDINLHETIWKNYIKKVTPIEKLFDKKVRKIFYKMRMRSLDILYNGSKAIKSPDDFDTENFTAEMNQLSTVSAPLYSEAVLAGVTTLSEEIGMAIDFELTDPAAIRYLNYKIHKIKNVGVTIKNQIRSQLKEAMTEGESIDQMAKRIKEVFNASTRRARTIARTEVVGASNFGRTKAIDKTRFKQKQWFTAMDEKVRAAHRDFEPKIINVGEMWIVDGEALKYPGDYAGSAGNIINCRCIEIVVPGSFE